MDVRFGLNLYDGETERVASRFAQPRPEPSGPTCFGSSVVSTPPCPAPLLRSV